MTGRVEAVSRGATHSLAKADQPEIQLIAGLGVAGDAHAGSTVQHRSRVARDPHQPNLRQVHLIHAELHEELRGAGFHVSAGQMGENITTRGIELLGLPTGTRLRLGDEAIVEITGLRNPLRTARRDPGRLDGGGARPRRAGAADPQGGRHGGGHRGWCGPAGGRGRHRAAAGAAPPARAGLSLRRRRHPAISGGVRRVGCRHLAGRADADLGPSGASFPMRQPGA